MKLIVKLMQGKDSKECSVDVQSDASVITLKNAIALTMAIPTDRQKLVFKGKNLSDEKTLVDYGISNGNKLFLFEKDGNISRQNPRALWIAMETLLRKHFTPSDALIVLRQFEKDYSNTMANLSLDDIERIAKANKGCRRS